MSWGAAIDSVDCVACVGSAGVWCADGGTRRLVGGDARDAGRIPPSRLEVIEGAGHLTPVKWPEEFARIVAEFYGEQPGGRAQ